MLQKFIEIYSDKYKNLLQCYQQHSIDEKDFTEHHSNSIYDLQQFIRVIQEIMSLYYNLDTIGSKFNQYCLFTKDNLLNFATNIVLNDELYFLVFKMQSLLLKPHDLKFKESSKFFYKYEPQDFGILPEFCLNQLTIDYISSSNLKKNEFTLNFTKPILTQQKSFEKSMAISPTNILKTTFDRDNDKYRSFHNSNEDHIIGNMTRSKSQVSINEISNNKEPDNDISKYNDDSFINMSNNKPFEKAINTLKSIVFYKSPVHKLKIIIKTSELIEECIKDFYRKAGVNFIKNIDGEQISNIFIYIVSQCNIPNFFVNLKYIEKFSTSNTLNSKAGYYFATLEICFRHLEDLSEEKIKGEEKAKKSYLTESIKICLEDIKKNDINSFGGSNLESLNIKI